MAPIAASPLLLGLLPRFAGPPLTSWAQRTHGVDLGGDLPVIALLAVVLHVPIIAGMLGALAVLDDRDDGALQAIRVSPLGTRRYLAYRLALAAARSRVDGVTAVKALGIPCYAPLARRVLIPRPTVQQTATCLRGRAANGRASLSWPRGNSLIWPHLCDTPERVTA